jgi:deoxyinosine 3'endonuclease (endonuclease V)
VSASRSLATTTSAPAALAFSTKGRQSITAPSVAGYCTSTPSVGLAKSYVAASPTTTRTPLGLARARTTSMVCGWQVREMKKVRAFSLGCTARHRFMASAAAVPSSSIEALAMAMPVRSQTSVWKLRIASRRPCEISAW